MPKALIALIGLIGVLLFPATAAGKSEEYFFRGGDEPFSGEHPVGMTMIGHDASEPSKVTGFSIGDVDWNCTWGTEHQSYPQTFSLGNNSKATKTKRNENGDLYFAWSF